MSGTVRASRYVTVIEEFLEITITKRLFNYNCEWMGEVLMKVSL